MKVRQIGPNRTEVNTDQYSILVSYQTPVAYLDKSGTGFFRTSKKWSVTTSKHINQWLDGAKSQTVDQSVLDGLLEGLK